MKKIIFILVILISAICVYGQNPLLFSGVINTDSVSKEILFNRGSIWLAKTFIDSKEVIQFKDEANGQLIGRGTYQYKGADSYYDGFIEFNLELYFKDGRFKYVFNNFNHKGSSMNIGIITDQEEAPFKAFGSSKVLRNREWNKIKTEIKNNVDGLIDSLQKSISKPSDVENKNW